MPVASPFTILLSGFYVLHYFRFTTVSHNDGVNSEYTVAVCGNASKADPLAGVLQNGTTVLGRVNHTSVLKGGEHIFDFNFQLSL